MKFATESMKNLRPEDVRLAAEQLKHTNHQDIAEATEKMANASPEELASLRARADAQISYQISAAQMLKNQGNDLHACKQYHDAADKYLRVSYLYSIQAKDNLKGVPSAKSATLKQQCSLNLMSCYLKTLQFEDCIKEGSEAAVSDLSKAHEFSSDDETIAEVLSDAKEMLMKDEGVSRSQGVVIEEIDEDETRPVPSNSHCSTEYSIEQPIECAESPQNDGFDGGVSAPDHGSYSGASAVDPEALRTFKDDPETIRLFQKYVSNADANSLSAMGLGGMPPDIIKTTTELVSSMKPDELQKMLEIASSLQGSDGPKFPSMNGNVMSPELIRMSSEKISRMSPEELKKMYKFSSSFGASSAMPASDFGTRISESASQSSVPTANPSISLREAGSSSAHGLPSQETMANSMKDPAMQQLFTSMMKNMSPEMMANMSEQFGMKLSREDAAKAQQAMASLSPEDLDRMMRWAGKAQKGIETAKNTKKWLLERRWLILSILLLILAIILHKLGYLGS
ncbi:hypothetical protein KSP39_PZI021177 [Platanthera zijinensis]|uniref:Outer envelope protein 61 n=1 Tax=Platanthera zijinensis TaxID=2320716 RepID=A0AAP0FVM0_9ASPA